MDYEQVTRALLKPWPRDAVMVIAADAGAADLPKMEGIEFAECRDCGAKLHADTKTVRRAFELPARKGRPIKFFCCRCLPFYDLGSVSPGNFHDDSGHFTPEPLPDFRCTAAGPWAPGRNQPFQPVAHPDAKPASVEPQLATLGLVRCPHCGLVFMG